MAGLVISPCKTDDNPVQRSEDGLNTYPPHECQASKVCTVGCLLATHRHSVASAVAAVCNKPVPVNCTVHNRQCRALVAALIAAARRHRLTERSLVLHSDPNVH